MGIIDGVGDRVSEWTVGQRVGVGWHGGHDGTCISCRRGDFGNCQNMKIPGISYDGGYQQYMVTPVEALVAMPENLNETEAAPLLCAGVTTFNALRHAGALPPDLVAVQGIGAWATLNSIREQVWLQGRGYRTRSRKRGARKETLERASTSIAKRRTQQRSCKN